MADKIVSWGGFDSKGTSGMGVTGSLSVNGNMYVGTIPTASVPFMTNSPNVVFGAGVNYAGIYGSSENGIFQFKTSGYTADLVIRPGSEPIVWNSAYWTTLRNSARDTYLFGGLYHDSVNLGVGTTSLLTIYNPTAAAGHVGIGTTTPHYKLQIAGTAYSGSFNANNQVIINTAGNMGVGTTAPTARLQVRGSGTTSATTTLLIQNANASASLSITDDGTSTFTYPGVAGYFLKLSGAYSGNGISAVYETLGGTGAYYGIHEFKTGTNVGSSARTLSILYGGRVVIGNKSNTDLQFPKGNLLIDTNFVNTFSGAAPESTAFNTGIVINPTGSINTQITASGIQFNFATAGPNDNNGGAFIGAQWNPLVGGYDTDLVVYTTQANAGSYNEIARFVGKRKSLSLGAGRNPSASLHISGASSAALLEIDSPAVNNILFVSGSGNVGIGTSSPTYKLHVSSSNNNDGIAIHYPSTNSTQFPFYVGDNSNGVYARLNTSDFEFKRNGAASTIKTVGSSNNLVLESATNLVFNTNGATTQMYINSTGNVGINTTTDAGYKLDVNGSTRIKGVGTASILTVQTSAGSDAFVVYGDKTAYIWGANNSGYTTNILLGGQSNLANISFFGNNNIYVGQGNSTENIPSALIAMGSTTKGFLPPRMTGAQAEAISSPAEGLMVYATSGSGATITSKGWWGYNGATWEKLN